MIERYTLPEMGKIWEDEFKFSTWLKMECDILFKTIKVVVLGKGQ